MTSPSTIWTLACLGAALSGSVTAQSWGPSPAPIRAGVSAERAALNTWTSGLELRNVGPSVMGGRVVDVAVVSDTMYVAYATGGLW